MAEMRTLSRLNSIFKDGWRQGHNLKTRSEALVFLGFFAEFFKICDKPGKKAR
jgi:hypothetical protein